MQTSGKQLRRIRTAAEQPLSLTVYNGVADGCTPGPESVTIPIIVLSLTSANGLFWRFAPEERPRRIPEVRIRPEIPQYRS